MSQPDPCSVVRIAIALVALKYKSRDQSIASYLLDLQSHFPVVTKDNDSRDWRTYALELEKQLTAVKAQRDVDQELLSRLRTDASQVASTSDAPPPKKRSKKNPTKDQYDPERSWDQSRADWSRFLSSQYPSSPSLIAAYTSLKGALAFPNTDHLSYASRLADAILRAFDTIHFFLFSPPNPTPDLQIQTALGAPSQLKPEYIDSTRIALTSPLLTYVLRTALPALLRTAHDSTKSKRPRLRLHAATLASADAHAHTDRALNHLLECILLPLLHALVPLCSMRLAPLLSVSLKKDKHKNKGGRAVGKAKNKHKDAGSASGDLPTQTDARTDVFALIGTSLEALDALPPLVRPLGPGAVGAGGAGGGGTGGIASGIRDRLGLETIRELEALYAVPPPPSSLQPPSQPPPAMATPSLEPPLPTPTPASLSAPPPSSSPSHSHSQSQPRTESLAKRLERLAGTRADRVRALATKDAGWFLASTLHLCVTPMPTPAPTSGLRAAGHGAPRDHDVSAPDAGRGRAEHPGGLDLLREALLARIGKLVWSLPLGGRVSEDNPSQQDSDKFAIDPVCQNMLLAICERALSQLAPL